MGKSAPARGAGKIMKIELNRLPGNDYVGLLVRVIVGSIFIYASLDKIGAPSQFARIVYNYHILPAELINLAALLLPWVELTCGVSLILGVYKDGSALIVNLLVAVFIIAIGINLFRGIDLECGCFTVSSKAKSNTLSLLLRDLGLLVLTLYIFFNRSERFLLVKNRHSSKRKQRRDQE
jgi:uncharacterized membrane protein YphA (DoxX/SURF4 family)